MPNGARMTITHMEATERQWLEWCSMETFFGA
jgi:hypothetical protein